MMGLVRRLSHGPGAWARGAEIVARAGAWVWGAGIVARAGAWVWGADIVARAGAGPADTPA